MQRVIGMDEVGRGCWAGPLVAGAVLLKDSPLRGGNIKVSDIVLRDSKMMSRKQRQTTDAWVQEHAEAWGLGWVWPAEIDAYGLTWAVRTAMERALAKLPTDYDELIIDGNINYFPHDVRAVALVKADATVPTVSAASIIAKVARDTYMASLDERYAGYGFETHVGYGTAAHRTALRTLGVTDIHRKSYRPVRELLA